jgi:hypothetical protein
MANRLTDAQRITLRDELQVLCCNAGFATDDTLSYLNMAVDSILLREHDFTWGEDEGGTESDVLGDIQRYCVQELDNHHLDEVVAADGTRYNILITASLLPRDTDLDEANAEYEADITRHTALDEAQGDGELAAIVKDLRVAEALHTQSDSTAEVSNILSCAIVRLNALANEVGE